MFTTNHLHPNLVEDIKNIIRLNEAPIHLTSLQEALRSGYLSGKGFTTHRLPSRWRLSRDFATTLIYHSPEFKITFKHKGGDPQRVVTATLIDIAE